MTDNDQNPGSQGPEHIRPVRVGAPASSASPGSPPASDRFGAVYMAPSAGAKGATKVPELSEQGSVAIGLARNGIARAVEWGVDKDEFLAAVGEQFDVLQEQRKASRSNVKE